jgi:hypothetical protein
VSARLFSPRPKPDKYISTSDNVCTLEKRWSGSSY